MDKLLSDRVFLAIKPSPMCRDCADFGPRCPNSGELCHPTDCARELSGLVESIEAQLKQKNEVNSIYDLIDEAYDRFGDDHDDLIDISSEMSNAMEEIRRAHNRVRVLLHTSPPQEKDND